MKLNRKLLGPAVLGAIWYAVSGSGQRRRSGFFGRRKHHGSWLSRAMRQLPFAFR